MNSSNNESDIFFPIDYWLSQFGSSWLTDSLHLFGLLPLSLLGATFNLLSFIILIQEKFRNSLFYNYLKVYTLNSVLVNLAQALFFWPNTMRYFAISNTYAAFFYQSFIYMPLINSTVLFGSLMDILISLERLFKFYPHLEAKFAKRPIWQINTIFLAFTAVLCFQYVFKFVPAFIDVPLSHSVMFRIHFFMGTSFTGSLWGKVLNYVVYFIRDVLCLFAETGLNICVAVLLSQQIKMKIKLTNAANSSRQNLSRSDQKASQMVIIMCSLSTLEHIFFFSMAVNFDYNMNSFAYLLGVTANICITLKHGSNLLLFYYFNSPFRKAFKRQLGFTSVETISGLSTNPNKNNGLNLSRFNL